MRPLRRKPVRRYLLATYVFSYVLGVLWFHYIGYRSYHPEFHRVRETLYDSARDGIWAAFVPTIFLYVSLLRERNWL